tara:strand:+ start:417 stop:1511 length:1095 start_codon:yes stop_codon:yes gene_type:complete
MITTNNIGTSKKIESKFYCPHCNYYSNNKYNFNKHLLTTKHLKSLDFKKRKKISYINVNYQNDINSNFICNCGKKYKHKSGLSRHKKKCPHAINCDYINENEIEISLPVKKKSKKVKKESEDLTENILNESEDLLEVVNDIKQNTETNKFGETINHMIDAFTKQSELLEKLIDNQKNIIPKIGSNNNNSIAINVFLNEKCKNAMNISDFIETIKVSMADLEYTNENGFVKGISNIFTKRLTDMKITERPIHCSNSTEQLHFFIKDENEWGEDKSDKKINGTIKKITRLQAYKLKEWEAANPTYMEDDKLYNQWQSMIYNVTEDVNGETNKRNIIDIKKNIGENVSVEPILNEEETNNIIMLDDN